VGCNVVTSDGEELGTVVDVFRVGEGEVFTVRGPGGEILVPAVASVVRELNPAERRIVVDADALGLTNPAANEIKP
jgi:16S rRNA processing protein RimM